MAVSNVAESNMAMLQHLLIFYIKGVAKCAKSVIIFLQ